MRAKRRAFPSMGAARGRDAWPRRVGRPAAGMKRSTYMYLAKTAVDSEKVWSPKLSLESACNPMCSLHVELYSSCSLGLAKS